MCYYYKTFNFSNQIKYRPILIIIKERMIVFNKILSADSVNNKLFNKQNKLNKMYIKATHFERNAS